MRNVNNTVPPRRPTTARPQLPQLPQGMPTRFLQEVGTVAYLRRYWHDEVPCRQGWDYHNAMRVLTTSQSLDDFKLGGEVKDVPADAWPCECKYCQTPVPEGTSYQILHKRLYRAAQGEEVAYDELKPGDLFFVREHYYDEKRCPYGWTNCDGNHLHAITPNGHHWNIDSRAKNCTLKDDTLHRCWVRHGDPKNEPVHVDKKGLTCAAGGGSIIVPGYHGFLHNGYFTVGS